MTTVQELAKNMSSGKQIDAILLDLSKAVDFLYLNSNTQAFLYTIPNVDELTGSFTRHIPNFISSIDFRTGFFQMRVSPESTKY
jgi:hypothetical protein